MSDQDYDIYVRLRNNPGHLHVSPDKKKVYHLEGEQMYVIAGDFAGKTEAEINKIVCVATQHC